MIFTPEKYSIEDKVGVPFIDTAEIENLLRVSSSESEIDEIIDISMSKKRLSLAQVATLLNATTQQREKVITAARELKKQIYGNRIVLFAPLYIGNECSNGCTYCSFKADNSLITRKTLSPTELISEVEALEDVGHKRLILVYGEHSRYDAEFIARSVKECYGVKKGNGEIRRVNINAAPLSEDGFATVKEAGIGTYQVFQESYHPEVYNKYHPYGRKSDYAWRLTAFDRAMSAGIDDVGLGALFGLGDWKFEVMALVRHTSHLEACFGVGPHTISFPRITQTLGADHCEMPLTDEDFLYMIAVLRLAVPYTGLILTARESEDIREKAIANGVTQIDGGTKLDIGSYSASDDGNSSQFTINDNRSLSEVIERLIQGERIPSFCTACYRKGRTGEHFMEFSTKGFIKRFCSPNAILSFAEYLEDYGSETVKEKGRKLIEDELTALKNSAQYQQILSRLERIARGERDLFF